MIKRILLTATLSACTSAPEPAPVLARLAHCNWNIALNQKCAADTPNEGDQFFVAAPQCSIVKVRVDGRGMQVRITDDPVAVGNASQIIEVTGCQLYKNNWHPDSSKAGA